MRAVSEFFCTIWWSVREKVKLPPKNEWNSWLTRVAQVEVMQEVAGSCESENTCEGVHEKCTMIPRCRYLFPSDSYLGIPGNTWEYCTHAIPEYARIIWSAQWLIPRWEFSHLTHIIPGYHCLPIRSARWYLSEDTIFPHDSYYEQVYSVKL